MANLLGIIGANSSLVFSRSKVNLLGFNDPNTPQYIYIYIYILWIVFGLTSVKLLFESSATVILA